MSTTFRNLSISAGCRAGNETVNQYPLELHGAFDKKTPKLTGELCSNTKAIR